MQLFVIRALWVALILLASNFNKSLYAESDSAVKEPSFSHVTGFYPQAFNLKLKHSDLSVKIYYTLDGSVPDPDNLVGSTYQYKNEYELPPNKPSGELFNKNYQTYLYDKSIFIDNLSSQPNRLANISTTFDKYPNYFPKKVRDTWFNKFTHYFNYAIDFANNIIVRINRVVNTVINKLSFSSKEVEQKKIFHINLIPSIRQDYDYIPIFKGVPVRAIAVDSESNISKELSNIFFIGERSYFSLPIVSMIIPEKVLFDYQEGVFVAGNDYDSWLSSIGATVDSAERSVSNWHRKVKDTEARITFININNQSDLDQPVNIRIHGAWSRRLPNKSLRIYPIKNDVNNGVAYDVFDDGINLGLSRIILRNGGNNAETIYISDAATHRIMANLNYGIQRYRPFVTFINGEYYGIYNVRDRLDKYYLEQMFNLPSRKVDLLKKDKIVQHGSDEEWSKLLKFIENEDKNNSFYAKLNSKIDIDSFIDYYVSEIFIANTDWSQNNIRYWRYRGSKKHPITNEGYTDGRWRWLMYDTDHAFGFSSRNKLGAKHNTLEYAASSSDSEPGWKNFMLHSLLQNTDFKLNFIIRFADLLNSNFLPARTVAIIKDTEAGIESEMPKHIERWGAPMSMQFWRSQVNKAVQFVEQRPAYQFQHLNDYFELDGFYSVSIDLAEPGTGTVQVNSLTLGEAVTSPLVTDISLDLPWSGQYFRNLPLTLTARPASGYSFSHWESEGLTKEQASSSELILEPNDDIKIRAVMKLK